MAKEYIVMKDGAELKTYKSLPAAKALAEKEDAEVYSDGECVYSPTVEPAVISSDPPAVEETKVEDKPQAEKYTLLRKMNVRKEPSLTAEKVAVLDGGTVVEVGKKVDDWLHLTDGTFIYYEGGKNARKA
ncbi:MAG TPA: SH3 domain-containing protein [Candidatus Sabulitectum sp.]|mgnify:CR=1 FL=1|nr:SH3 domain-containing protein [Candidatus Sabulitectum sp.]